MAARGRPLWVMLWRSRCVYKLRWKRLFHVWEPAVGKIGDPAAYTWPNVLTVQRNAGSQPPKIRAKNQRWRKGGNRRQRREVMRGGEPAAEWLNYFFSLLFCSLHWWDAQSSDRGLPQHPAHDDESCSVGFPYYSLLMCVDFNPKRIHVQGEGGAAGSLDRMAHLFNKNNI